jgi:hypothetical protein
LTDETFGQWNVLGRETGTIIREETGTMGDLLRVSEAHEECREAKDQAYQHAPTPNEMYPVLCRSE